MRPLPGFIGPAYATRSRNYSSQRLVNMYLEKGRGKAPAMFVGTPGINSIVGKTYGIRGMLPLTETRAVVVAGPNVHLVEETNLSTLSSTGTIANDGQPVSIAFDGSNILIASADNLYGSTISDVSTQTLVRANVSSVDFIDGFFVLTESGSGRFFVSGQYTTTIDALDFATAEGSPDNLVRVLVHNREALMFGSNTLEVWYVAGGEFPMSRVQGAFVEEGLAAKNSAVSCGSTVCWLGGSQDGGANVWMLNGYQPQLISTPAINYAISQWPTLSDAWAFFYKQEGHAFYVLSSPSGNETWAYDFAEGEWHQRASLDLDAGSLARLRYATHMYFGGRNIVGDWEDNPESGKVRGLLHELSLEYLLDQDVIIPRIRRCGILQDGLEMLRNASLQLDMDSGVGLDGGGVSVRVRNSGPGQFSTAGANPKASLIYSKDAGNTWSPELFANIGAIGEHSARVRWNRVGGGRRSVFEVKITEPVKVCITGAYFG